MECGQRVIVARQHEVAATEVVPREDKFGRPLHSACGTVPMAMTMRSISRAAQTLTALFLLSWLASAQLSPTAGSPDLATLVAQAHEAETRGDVGAAITSYQTVVRLDPQLAAAWNNLGVLLLKNRQFDLAAKALHCAPELRPHSAETEFLLGTASYDTSDLSEASSQLRAALSEKARPAQAAAGQQTFDSKEAADLLVTVLLRQGDEAEAASLLQARVKQNPADQEALYRLGRLYLSLSQTTLVHAREVAPNSVLAHLMQGEIEEGLGSLPAASSEYQEAARLDPDRPGVHDHLGNLLWIQGERSPARGEFTEELRHNPGNCVARWKIANTYLQGKQNFAPALALLDDSLHQCSGLT